MIVFLTLVYCAILFALVKFKIVPFNLFWKLSPVLWMIALFIFLFIPMQWGAPAGTVNVYQAVVEIVPNVAGEVVEVPAEGMHSLKKGDMLFRIDPEPYQQVVNSKKSELEDAIQKVRQLKASADAADSVVLKTQQDVDVLKADQRNAVADITAAEATLREAQAKKERADSIVADLQFQVETAEKELNRLKDLRNTGAVSGSELDIGQVQFTGLSAKLNTAVIDVRAAEESIAKANANLEVAKTNAIALDLRMKQLVEAELPRVTFNAKQARIAADARIGDKPTLVATAEAELAKAEFDLRQTDVRAPSDGYIMAMTLRPGQRAANLPFRPLMSFVSDDETTIAVGIPQYTLRHVQPGQKAEVAFKRFPGRVFPATVNRIAQISAPGQLMPTGTVPDAPTAEPAAPFFVILDLDEDVDIDVTRIQGGTAGTAAIYTQSMTPTHVIRKVMVRMDAWLNYVLP